MPASNGHVHHGLHSESIIASQHWHILIHTGVARSNGPTSQWRASREHLHVLSRNVTPGELKASLNT